MKKYRLLLCAFVATLLLVGCGQSDNKTNTQADTEKESQTTEEPQTNAGEPVEVKDGVYTVDFNTDSAMFHLNETCNGKATLTVENGKKTVHIILVSKNIVNLYVGLAADAEGASDILSPIEEEVDYGDGTTDVVYAFDVPVEEVGVEFDLAILGKKGNWYDHKVSVLNPVVAGE